MNARTRRPDSRLLVVLALVTGAAALFGGLPGATPEAAAYPEPAIVTDTWKLDFTWQKPEPIAVEQADGSYEWYWYLPYKVVNNTGSKVLYIPEFTIATDTGQIISAGKNVPASLFDRIKQQLGNPLLESPIAVVGQLLQGEDYAKESVIIWPAFEKDVDELNIFISGLSGETATVRNPMTNEPVLMRRTLMLQYTLPGDPPTPQQQTVLFQNRRDVMR